MPRQPKYTKTNPHKGIHKGGGGRRPPPPFVEAAEGRLLYMGVGFRVFGLSGHLTVHSDKLSQQLVTQLVQMDNVKLNVDKSHFLTLFDHFWAPFWRPWKQFWCQNGAQKGSGQQKFTCFDASRCQHCGNQRKPARISRKSHQGGGKNYLRGKTYD